MAIQQINIGAAPNDKTGDKARDWAQKTNANFTNPDHAASKLMATDAQAIAGTPGVIPNAEQVRKNHLAQVATIADLIAIAPAFDGQQVELLGYTVAGIGGGALYYDASSAAVVDSISIFAVAAGFPGRWIRSTPTYNGMRTTGYGEVIIGDNAVTGAGLRDAINIARDVVGLTDCHGFADKTIISGVTDAGTYGVFDSTVEVQGGHTHNHIYSFQDRNNYSGSGTLTEMSGLMSIPKHTGSGVITSRYGVDIRDVSVTGGGSIGTNIGVFIRDLISGGSKAAITILQSTGHAIFASGLGKNYFRGDTGIGGGQNTSGVALTVQGSASSPQWYAHSTSGAVQTGAIGDFNYQVIAGGSARLEVTNSAGSYAVRPGADNTQPLGDLSKRWATVYAGTGTINTSDAREKTPVRSLSQAELSAASQLSKEIGAYRWLSAVAAKGDDAREHIGMTVQRAIEVMESHGLEPFRYGFICFDEFEGGDRYSFRPDELLAFIAAGLEARISALEIN